ncbi:MAG: hypothetical protein U0271_02545 [Polyangiaceae bacterium]
MRSRVSPAPTLPTSRRSTLTHARGGADLEALEKVLAAVTKD